MISEKMLALAQSNSAIRAMFEEGSRLAALHGRENVFDFSLGNPNFPAPEAVNRAIRDVIEREDSRLVHGYMSNAGYADVRGAVAASLNRRFGTAFGADNIIMSVGAAGGLNAVLKTLLNPGDEVIAFAPYFVEYGNYVANYDCKLVVVPPNTEDFRPDPRLLEAAVTPRTKAVIVNSPNNQRASCTPPRRSRASPRFSKPSIAHTKRISASCRTSRIGSSPTTAWMSRTLPNFMRTPSCVTRGRSRSPCPENASATSSSPTRCTRTSASLRPSASPRACSASSTRPP